VEASRSGAAPGPACSSDGPLGTPQQRLAYFPLPHAHGQFRPTLAIWLPPIPPSLLAAKRTPVREGGHLASHTGEGEGFLKSKY
jgi:hypothetical protein